METKTRKTGILLLAAIFSASVFAQGEKEEPKFKGNVVATVFANYGQGFGAQNGTSGFNLDRSYLGYQFSYGEKFSGKVVLDIGPTKLPNADIERVAYVKNAFLTYKIKNFSVSGGLIGLEQFSVQEKFWGYRYILKSFQDENKFGSSADMGLLLKYKVCDQLSFDASVTNGEGYKKLNKDNRYRYSVATTITPVKNLIVRAYYDATSKPSSAPSDAKTAQNLALFVGATAGKFSLGAEYDTYFNSDFAGGHTKSGVSAYAKVKLPKKTEIFARYDNLMSKDDWNKSKDNQSVIVGLQYAPVKFLKISPNFRAKMPKADGADNELFGYVNVQFAL